MADYVRMILMNFWDTILEMAPYLLFGFFVAGVLSVLVSQPMVERHLGGRGFWPLFKASLFGVPLPLCSCSVIPVSMSLRKHGASKGATIAFLLSTPQTGVDSILVTLSLLGPVFAIFRPFAALATGLVGGTLVDIFGHNGGTESQTPEKCTDECCSGKQPSRVIRGLKYAFVTLPGDIGKAMVIGLVVAAFISALVPANFFADKLGTGLFAMVVMMFLGIPVYVCATASVPIAAAMIMKGLSPGAALVFLMTGPATNAAAFVTIWKVLGRRTAIIYLASVAGCALAGGILLDSIAAGVNIEISHGAHHMLPDMVKYASAIALVAVMGYAFWPKTKHAHTSEKSHPHPDNSNRDEAATQ